MPRNQKGSVDLAAFDRDIKVLELRRSGLTFEEIAKEVGLSRNGVVMGYKRAMKRALIRAGSEELRDIELDRLDRLQRAVWERAMNADLPAVQTVLRIMEQRAKLLGLNAPETHKVEVSVLDPNTVDAEVLRLAEMLKEANKAKGALPPAEDDSDILDGEIVDDDEMP